MSFLKKYFKIYGVLFVLGIFFVSCESICDLLLPTVSQNIIDDGIQKSDMHYVIHMGIIMFSIVAAGALFACIRNIIACTVSQKFGADLRFDLFSKIQKLSVADTDRFEGGSLVTRLTNDITQLTNFSAGLMRVIVKAPVLCIGSILMIWMNNYYMLPVFLIAVVYAFFTIFMSIHFSYPQFKKVQESIDRVNVVMREYLAGIRIVRAFGRYDYERSRFDESNSDLSHTTMKATRILAIFNPLMMLGINVSIAIIIWLSSHWINLGNMEVGQMSAAIMYMGQLLTSLTMISNFLNNFARTKASTERIGEVMSTEEDPALKDLPGAEMPETASIQFHDVCFTYPKSSGEAALTDI
ncbi:MAG: ABC transporter ATP-binding protein, partial [Clostridiales bacterium]|nr:ABC transporter ATP-binding protein [Clostridiales bacterium]